jgi:hypothetical protein
MPKEPSGLSILDYPSEVLDKVSDLFGAVGIELTPFAGQVILLLLTVITLLVFRKRYWPLKNAQPLWSIGAGALGIVLIGIIFSWVYYLINPLPDHIFGKVNSEDLTDVGVGATDFRGDQIPAGSGVVDSRTGEFALRYEVSFGDRPRALIISKPNCDDQKVPISRAKLRAQSDFNVNYTCKEK